MKAFQKYQGFWRYLLSYLCVLLLPLVVFLFFGNHFYTNIYRNEVIRQNQTNLDRLRDDLDGQISQLEAIAGQMTVQDSVNDRQILSKVTAYEEIRRILQGYAATHPFLESVSFYTSATPDTVYTESGTFNVDLFRHYEAEGSSLTVEERLSGQPFESWWRVEKMSWPFSDRKTFLEYAVPVPGIPGSYMLFTFSEKALAQFADISDSKTAVYDTESRRLFPSGELDLTVETFLAGNPDKESSCDLLEDGRYLFISRSNATGLTYTRTISKSVMLAPVQNFQQLFIILFVILALVGGAAVYIFSMLSYRPIRKLDSLTERYPLDVPENLHGVERADFVFQRLDERYVSLERDARRERHLYRLIHGRNQNGDCEESLAKAGICFSSRLLRVVLLSFEPEKDGRETIDVIETVEQVLSGQYETAGMEYLDNNYYLILIGYDKENEEILQNKLMTVASCLGGNPRITVGGPVETLAQVSQSYNQALLAARMADTAEPVRFFDEGSMGKMRFLYPKIELDTLYNAVVNADGDKVNMISDILTDMIKANARNSFIALSLSGDMINTLLRGLEELNPAAGGYYARFTNQCIPSDLPSYLDAISQLREEITSVIGSRPAVSAQEDTLQKMLAFINENCECEDLCVSYVAEHFQMSMSNLSHQFKALTGRNISEYIAEKKMQFAKKLLRTTDLSISDVAIRLGYNQTSSFIRKFKQCENRTPNEYRMACQEHPERP